MEVASSSWEGPGLPVRSVFRHVIVIVLHLMIEEDLRRGGGGLTRIWNLKLNFPLLEIPWAEGHLRLGCCYSWMFFFFHHDVMLGIPRCPVNTARFPFSSHLEIGGDSWSFQANSGGLAILLGERGACPWSIESPGYPKVLHGGTLQIQWVIPGWGDGARKVSFYGHTLVDNMIKWLITWALGYGSFPVKLFKDIRIL